MARDTQTHFLDGEYAARFADGTFESVCGARVCDAQVSSTPTCGGCAAWIEDTERQLQALLHERPDPALLVAPTHFDATAGYRPRSGRRR